MRRPSGFWLVLGWACVPAGAQVVTEMTRERIEQAIAQGVAQRPAPYALRNATIWLEFDTPFLRLSTRAAKEGAGDASLATPELLKPELHARAGPESWGEDPPSVKKLTLVKADGSTVAPVSQQSFVDYAQSPRRKKIALRGVHAVFPLSALQPGVRFRLQMSNGRVHTLSPDAAWFESPR